MNLPIKFFFKTLDLVSFLFEKRHVYWVFDEFFNHVASKKQEISYRD